jgi:hypothetical protein
MKPKAKGFFYYVPMRFISKESFPGASIWLRLLRVLAVSFSFVTAPSLPGARLERMCDEVGAMANDDVSRVRRGRGATALRRYGAASEEHREKGVIQLLMRA